MFASWADFYKSDIQSVYAPWVAPTVFLVFWLLAQPDRRAGVEPRAARFMQIYAPLFAIETILDPYATGPLARWLGFEEPFATLWMVLFVLLGDFRVYLLVFGVLAPERGIAAAVRRAAAWTLIVPVVAWSVRYGLEWRYGSLPSQTIWISYEVAFFAIALFLERRALPTIDFRRYEVRLYLRAVLRYVQLYYALWAVSDLLIVLRGVDWGWGLRAIPNQLYYGLWIPFVYLSFFSRRYAPINRSVHAAR